MFKRAVEAPSPVNEVQLCRISLDRITCDNTDNPRLSDNESYEEIKSSIAASAGRYLVLEVSQRPGSQYFELRRGGKTRLQIATELKQQWDEEGRADTNPFTEVNCLVYPWVDESEHRIMNVTENLARGALSYGEMAKAIALLEQVYLALPGVEPNMKGFSAWAQQLGLSIKISVTQIQRYKEVNDVLMVIMPTLFIEGRASSVVARQLLEMRAKVRKVFKDHYDNGEDNHFLAQTEADTLFNRVAQQFDAVTFRHKDIQRTLKQEIAQARHYPITGVSMTNSVPLTPGSAASNSDNTTNWMNRLISARTISETPPSSSTGSCAVITARIAGSRDDSA